MQRLQDALMRSMTPMLFAALAASPAFAQVKVYISADMEGIGGVVTGEQLGTSGFEYQRFREFMTEEVLAAIRGARAGGATEILVSDSHGNGQNLLIDRLPDDVQVVRSWPRPLGMMEGVDETFACVLFMGTTARLPTPRECAPTRSRAPLSPTSDSTRSRWRKRASTPPSPAISECRWR
jgi:hypothetical protein